MSGLNRRRMFLRPVIRRRRLGAERAIIARSITIKRTKADISPRGKSPKFFQKKFAPASGHFVNRRDANTSIP